MLQNEHFSRETKWKKFARVKPIQKTFVHFCTPKSKEAHASTYTKILRMYTHWGFEEKAIDVT